MKKYKVQKSNDEWKKILTPEQFKVLRLKGTERSYSGKYQKLYEEGIYACAACGHDLFSSEHKYDSGSGWPSFYQELEGSGVEKVIDLSRGWIRTEVRCPCCGGHLGHVFSDKPSSPTGARFCINSVAMIFKPKNQSQRQPS